ncbi:hypothetical protein PSAB6_510016 [Paraburkholderia sabiae]|nr:hypothetical protein PSAB6_510016 [Paraburkholderia sabiae]
MARPFTAPDGATWDLTVAARPPNASRAGDPQWGQKETDPDTLPPQRAQVAEKIGPRAA